jgi:hemerythrin
MTMNPEADVVFELGQHELDREHQGQIDLLLAIEAELRDACDQAQLRELLDRLVEFTSIHFMSEQLIMRQQAFPGLPAHEAEHDRLMDEMREFQGRIGSGERPLSPADLANLRDWVMRHIRTKDAPFAKFLGDHGAGAPAHGGG